MNIEIEWHDTYGVFELRPGEWGVVLPNGASHLNYPTKADAVAAGAYIMELNTVINGRLQTQVSS